MKKLNILAMLFLTLGAVALTSCKDDNDENPTVKQPETFHLNTPALANNTLDLSSTNTIDFTWSQPDYGYTAPVYYYLQFSTTDTWEETTNDEGEKVRTYTEVEGSVTTPKISLSCETLNRQLMKDLGINSADELVDVATVYFRIHAKLNAGYDVYSDVVPMTVSPYFQTLVSADPEIWYLVGSCIGDGSWSNSDKSGSEIGKSLIPFSIINGEKYDDLTGKGLLTYTGYFPADAIFKFILTPGSWDDQIGMTDGEVKVNDGGSGNFTVPAAGYYTIMFNTKNYTVDITSVDTPYEYTQMLISGSFNGWATDEHMTAVDTYSGAINHVWKYEADWSEDVAFKFLVDSSWAPNWGMDSYNFGIGVSNGPNIPAYAGKYLIIFNDVTGYYHLYPKE